MAAISVTKVEGFSCPYPVQIFDDKHRLFLEADGSTKKPARFNLTSGNFFSDAILKRGEKVDYSKKIRTLEKFTAQKDVSRVPDEIDVIYEPNANKCSVEFFGNKVKIIADNWHFSRMTKPQKAFIFFHEVGHFFHRGRGHDPKGEKKCDATAALIMLKRGYNPEQIISAISETLGDTPETKERIKSIKSLLK